MLMGLRLAGRRRSATIYGRDKGLNMQMLQSKMFPRTYFLKNSCSIVKINLWQKENKTEK